MHRHSFSTIATVLCSITNFESRSIFHNYKEHTFTFLVCRFPRTAAGILENVASNLVMLSPATPVTLVLNCHAQIINVAIFNSNLQMCYPKKCISPQIFFFVALQN
jgi:hypothetical protein